MSKPETTGLRAPHHFVVFLVSFALVASRRPDALLHAQFWAEDGHTWYADAYNLGWFDALARTWAGYFQLAPRLAAALALLVPLVRAPLVMNVVAIAAYVLPVNLLLSSRSVGWGSLRFRALLAASYIGFPLSPEVRGIATNMQWTLVLAALFIIVDSLPRNAFECICDGGILLTSGMSGPFCFFLLPIAVFQVHKHKEPWRWMPVGLMAACSLAQAWALLFFRSGPRGGGALGATPSLFVRILAGNVFLGSILGAKPFAVLPGTGAFLFLLLSAAGGAALAMLIFFRARTELKLFCVLAAMILTASLISPTTIATPETTRWQLLAEACGVRYWFLPALSFVWLLICAVHGRSTSLKGISALLLFLLVPSTVFQWTQNMFRDLHFAEQAARFQAAPVGETVVIPENPDGWTLRLVKH